MAETASFNSNNGYRRALARGISLSPGKTSEYGRPDGQDKKFEAPDPRSTALGTLVIFLTASALWVSDKGEIETDDCTTVDRQLIQVGAVDGPMLDWKNRFRSLLSYTPLMNDHRTLSDVAEGLSEDRGYYISTERFVAANRESEFVKFDSNGNLIQKMPVEATDSGTFCVSVPPPIYSGFETIQSQNVTLADLASEYFIDGAVIRNLNPNLADVLDDEPLPVGTTIRVTEAIDMGLVYREMTAEEENVNHVSAGNPALRQQIIQANIAAIGSGEALGVGERAFLPPLQTEFLEENQLTTEIVVSAFAPESVPLDVSFIEEAKEAAQEGEAAVVEADSAATVPEAAAPAIEGTIPTAAWDGTIVINAERFAETRWSQEELINIQTNLPFYLEAERATGVAWQLIAVLHERESNQGRSGPGNGQGPYQIYAERNTHKEGNLTDEEFLSETIHAAQLVANDYVRRAGFDVPPAADNIEGAMKVFFAYNGMASEYKDQAAALGFDPNTQGYQGSPYVMNLVDDNRNSAINPNWRQFRADGGDFREADQRPGTYLLYTDLLKITEFIPNAPTRAQLMEKYGGVSGQLEQSELMVIGEQWGGHRLNARAATAFREMNEAYKAVFGTDISITDSYRDFAGQVDAKARKGRYAATPGTSNHGWGFALDISNMGADNSPTPQYLWMMDNAPAFGWHNPAWARDNEGIEEPWHWEYED